MRALGVSPALPRGHELLGRIELALGHPREALAAFERERALNGETPAVAFHLGQAWQGLGDLKRARAAYRRAIDLDPGHRAALDSLAAISARSGG